MIVIAMIARLLAVSHIRLSCECEIKKGTPTCISICMIVRKQSYEQHPPLSLLEFANEMIWRGREGKSRSHRLMG